MRQAYSHYRDLRVELSRWLAQSSLMDGPCHNQGGEDEANYALTWFPHYLVTGEDAILERFRSLLADLAGWVETSCEHGYEPEAEAHHGTEPFLLFLPRYCGVCPEDEPAGRILEDAAHHIGNWVPEVPDWYDYGRDVFHSYHIGTRLVGDDPHSRYELAEHLRFVHIALAACRVTGDERYLEWALRYGRCRADRLLRSSDPRIPLLWDQEGRGLHWEDLTTREQNSMAANSHHVEGDPLSGIENLLASGAVQAFGDLYLLSGDDIFRSAARRVVEPLVDELLDPFGDPAAMVLSHYRWTFGDTSLDERILRVLERMPPESTAEWAMVLPEVRARREPGVGKRTDMIYWGEWSDDGSVRPLREPSTAALALGYQLTGDVALACRALAGASRKVAVARRVLRSGREHSDMGGAICSVAAGHGRNWGAGAVTGCYGPLVLGTRDLCGKVVPLVHTRDATGRNRVPEEVMCLVRPPVGGDGEVSFHNGSDREIEMSWLPADDPLDQVAGDDWISLRLAPGQVIRSSLAQPTTEREDTQ